VAAVSDRSGRLAAKLPFPDRLCLR
jgi:hypothetical protein